MRYRGYLIRRVNRSSQGRIYRHRGTKEKNDLYGETLSDLKDLINKVEDRKD